MSPTPLYTLLTSLIALIVFLIGAVTGIQVTRWMLRR